MQATMELINTASYISWKLPKNTTVVLTTNPDDGEFSVTSLDTAQKTRFVNFNLKLNVEDWASWAEFNNIDSRCINFELLYGEEIFKKHCSAVYSAMVLKDKVEIGQTVSSVMGFDWRMAPLIVLAEKLDKAETGEPVFGEHWEIVLYDEGLNVWHHMIKDGKPFWYKAAYLKGPFEKNTRYNLEVKVTKTRKGVKEMTLKCCGYEIGYIDNDLPDSFYAGIIGCEGRNMFYDFKVK